MPNIKAARDQEGEKWKLSLTLPITAEEREAIMLYGPPEIRFFESELMNALMWLGPHYTGSQVFDSAEEALQHATKTNKVYVDKMAQLVNRLHVDKEHTGEITFDS